MASPEDTQAAPQDQGPQAAAADQAPAPATKRPVTRYVLTLGFDLDDEAAAEVRESSAFTTETWGPDAPPAESVMLTGMVAGLCEALPALMTAEDSPNPEIGKPYLIPFKDPAFSNLLVKIDYAVPGYALMAQTDLLVTEVQTILGNIPNAIRAHDAWGREDFGVSLARSIENYVPPELLEALTTMNRIRDLGDLTDDIKERADCSELPDATSAWDHPDVKAWSDAVQVVKAYLPEAPKPRWLQNIEDMRDGKPLDGKPVDGNDPL